MKRHLTFKDGTSDKFWSIEAEGMSFIVTYGRTGSSGQTQKKTFGDEAECLDEAEKLVSEKLRKGYQETNLVSSKELKPEKPKQKTKPAVQKSTDSKTSEELLCTVSLYYQHGGSDKVYHIAIEKSGAGFVVNFSFGRRGSALKAGTKTSKAVTYELAFRTFNRSRAN